MIEHKLRSYLHHREFEHSNLRIRDIDNMIKKNISIFTASEYEIRHIPENENLLSFKNQLELIKEILDEFINIKDDVVVVVRSINLFPDNNGFFKLARRSPDGFGTISLKEMLFSLSGDVTVLSEHTFSYKDCDWMLIQSGEPDLEESLYKERNNLSRTKFNISRPNDGILSTGDFLGLKYLYKKLFPETSNK